jgi:hypothetical protein
LGVKLTKSIIPPPVGVLGPLGVRGGRDEDLARGVRGSAVPVSLMGPGLWIDFRRDWLYSVMQRMGDRRGLRRGLMVAGDTGGDGDREGDLRCLRGVLNGERSEKMCDGGGGRGGYACIGLGAIVEGGYGRATPMGGGPCGRKLRGSYSTAWPICSSSRY